MNEINYIDYEINYNGEMWIYNFFFYLNMHALYFIWYA